MASLQICDGCKAIVNGKKSVTHSVACRLKVMEQAPNNSNIAARVKKSLKKEAEHHSRLLEENFGLCLSRPPAEVVQPTNTHPAAQPSDDSAGNRDRVQDQGSGKLTASWSPKERCKKPHRAQDRENGLPTVSWNPKNRRRRRGRMPRWTNWCDQVCRRGPEEITRMMSTRRYNNPNNKGSDSSEALWKQWKTRRSRSRRRRANSR